MIDCTNCIVSDYGVVVWKSPQMHPLLRHTNVNHPDFARKAAESFSKGKVKGLPKICSENSEDARTWCLFSPLLDSSERRASSLANLLHQAFPGDFESTILDRLAAASLYFWHGKETPVLQLVPPPSLPFRQGKTEVDLIVALEDHLLVFIEAKFRSGVSSGVKHNPEWDQVIRNIDVGSWFSRGRVPDFRFILLQYGDFPTNAKSMVLRYKDRPETIKGALAHRTDLDDKQIEKLARSIAFVNWPDPLKQSAP